MMMMVGDDHDDIMYAYQRKCYISFISAAENRLCKLSALIESFLSFSISAQLFLIMEQGEEYR